MIIEYGTVHFVFKHTCIHTHAATPADYATDSFFFTDTFLNLTGVFAVEGRSVVIHEANRGEYVSRVSCRNVF